MTRRLCLLNTLRISVIHKIDAFDWCNTEILRDFTINNIDLFPIC